MDGIVDGSVAVVMPKLPELDRGSIQAEDAQNHDQYTGPWLFGSPNLSRCNLKPLQQQP
jgi:hypothetical protein